MTAAEAAAKTLEDEAMAAAEAEAFAPLDQAHDFVHLFLFLFFYIYFCATEEKAHDVLKSTPHSDFKQ